MKMLVCVLLVGCTVPNVFAQNHYTVPVGQDSYLDTITSQLQYVSGCKCCNDYCVYVWTPPSNIIPPFYMGNGNRLNAVNVFPNLEGIYTDSIIE